MERVDGRRFEDACHLTQALVLGYLKSVNEAFLSLSGVPNLCPVDEGGDDQGVVDLSPIEEVEASDGVAQEGDPSDGQSCTVGHDGDVVGCYDSTPISPFFSLT